jgi:malate permease and related proteins
LILVTFAVVFATAVGVLFERRSANARVAAGWALNSMLYVLVPFVAFVSFAHLQLTAAGGFGLLIAYLGLAIAGLTAWAVGRWVMHLRPAALGGLICSVIIVNTGYLGLPMTVALLGARHLPAAVAYDQIVSSPMLFIFGFAVGAAFATRPVAGGRRGASAFVLRNPPLLAAVAGLLAGASLVPDPLVHASHIVVEVLLPVGFFAVGVNLSSERRADAVRLLELPDRRVLLAVALRLTVTATMLLAVASLGVAIPAPYPLLAAMPTGVSSLIIGQAYGLDQRLIATSIVWSTAVVLTVGLIVALA